MFQLSITVVHPLGRFSGCVGMDPEDATEENIKALNEEVQLAARHGRFENLVLVTAQGSEMVFTEQILKDAILIFKVEEVVE